MKSQEKIIQIIEKAISDNPKIGSLKDGLFIMPAVWSPINRSMPLFFLFIFIITLPILLTTVSLEKYVFDLIMFSYIFLLFLIFLLLNVFSYHYLILDIKNNEFYTSSKLFNKISFWITNYVKTKSIKKIILKSGDVCLGGKAGNIFCDSIIVLSSNKEEIPLSELYPPSVHHDILVERCKLLSKCLEVEYQQKGEEELKNYIKLSKTEEGANRIIIAFIFIYFLILIFYLLYKSKILF